MLEQLKISGVKFEKGLTFEEISKIETIYGIKFPKTLEKFYIQVEPVSNDEYGFPKWSDFSFENIAKIKERIQNPMQWLENDVMKFDFWLAKWGEKPSNSLDKIKKFKTIITQAPKLIPLYGHRYIVDLEENDNPPVISTVGQDTIYYAKNLEEYFKTEFLGQQVSCENQIIIPFWSDIINRF